MFDNTGDDRIIDEMTWTGYQDRANATKILREHWDTFITEQDFAEIKAAGYNHFILLDRKDRRLLLAFYLFSLNHVRIPIGYWAFHLMEGETYIQGQLPYLKKAFKWAEKHDLKVIVDLHGAPGTQNGYVSSNRTFRQPSW